MFLNNATLHIAAYKDLIGRRFLYLKMSFCWRYEVYDMIYEEL